MKKLFLIVIAVAATVVANAQFDKAELQASGLTCSMCSNAINKALKTLPFAETVSADLNTNIFTIEFKKDQQIDFDLIKKKVEDAGFSVAKFWVTANLHNQQVANETHLVLGGLNLHFMNVKTQVLNGKERFQVIDKNFVQSKEFKKNAVYTSMPCYQTGMMGACCKSVGTSGRIYHVTI